MAPEDAGYHLLPHKIMILKRPSRARFKPFGLRLANIVQQSGPAQPFIITAFGHIVEHLQRVGKIILMATPFNHLHTFQLNQLGKDVGQQT